MTRTRIAATTAATLLLGAVAAIHFALAPSQLDEKTYVGALFIAAAVGATLAAAGVWRSDLHAAWMLGAAVCAVTFAGFVLSRTTGLPGGYKDDSWDLVGILSLVAEGAFVALYVVAVPTVLRRQRLVPVGR